MRFGLHNWLKFFRVVNLPTVPGDVLVGAAAATWCVRASLSAQELASVALAVAASCCIYMFGLADNDIVGAATDKDRPIPDGEISHSKVLREKGVICAKEEELRLWKKRNPSAASAGKRPDACPSSGCDGCAFLEQEKAC